MYSLVLCDGHAWSLGVCWCTFCLSNLWHFDSATMCIAFFALLLCLLFQISWVKNRFLRGVCLFCTILYIHEHCKLFKFLDFCYAVVTCWYVDTVSPAVSLASLHSRDTIGPTLSFQQFVCFLFLCFCFFFCFFFSFLFGYFSDRANPNMLRVFGLYSSDESKWQDNVLSPAVSIVQAALAVSCRNICLILFLNFFVIFKVFFFWYVRKSFGLNFHLFSLKSFWSSLVGWNACTCSTEFAACWGRDLEPTHMRPVWRQSVPWGPWVERFVHCGVLQCCLPKAKAKPKSSEQNILNKYYLK